VSGQSALAQSVVINEILQDPRLVSDSAGEWFEIFNPGAGDVDIDGWTIQDNDFDTHVINNGGPLVVPTGGFLILGNNADSGSNGGVTVAYVFSGLFLGNGTDELALFDGSGAEIDRVEYGSARGFPDSSGFSMSLRDPGLDNNVGANWCLASTAFNSRDFGTPGALNDCPGGGPPPPPPFGVCGEEATLISAIQGSSFDSPLNGAEHVVIEGVVVGDFQNSPNTVQLGGFFMQEEDFDDDGNPLTSEGIFVFQGGTATEVDAGDLVRVQGDVTEFIGLTEISNVSNLAVCGQGRAVTPATITLPVSSTVDFERREGMLVNLPQTLYVSGNFNWGRFGEVDLSVDSPLDNPTNVATPGPDALALSDLNNRSRIQLDDGSTVQNPMPFPPYIGEGKTLRTGDTVGGLTATLGSIFGSYELHPVGPVSFTRINERTEPPDVGGTVRVASFNVLNYFTTVDEDEIGPICGPLGNQNCRGADTQMEFNRQREKLVAAITKLDAHVVGLIEIENDPADVALADLVNGLNDHPSTAPGTYDYIATGPIGGDAIRVGLIYQPATVTPVNDFAILNSAVDPMFNDDLNRPALAQSFHENSGGTVFTVAVNHFKSKGSDCNDVGDPDAGDGQGNCNGVRTEAAVALTGWLASDPTGSGSGDNLIIGDLNAYAQEDPIAMIEMAGYIDLIEAFQGTSFADGAYSFNFFAESGYLDHALSSSSMLASVTGAAFWPINSDEP
jgi:predicted extracellular nuclease